MFYYLFFIQIPIIFEILDLLLILFKSLHLLICYPQFCLMCKQVTAQMSSS